MIFSFFGHDAQVSVLIDNERSHWIEDAIDNNFMPLSKNTWKGLWKLRIPNRTKTLMWRTNLNEI